MTIKKYFNDNMCNCLLKGEFINFEKVYNEYNMFKKLGNELSKKYEINKIIINKNGIYIPNIIINEKMEKDDPIVLNFIHNDVKSYIDFSILANTISKSLKKMFKLGMSNITNELNNIIINESISYDVLVELLPEVIEEYGVKKGLNNISEKLRSYDKTIRLQNYLSFNDKYSLYFHLLIIEIVYYTNRIYFESKPPKLCIDCHVPHYTNSDLCNKCIGIKNNERNKLNHKCKTIRKQLEKYMEDYGYLISPNSKEKINKLICKEHKYTDLKELTELKSTIEKELTLN